MHIVLGASGHIGSKVADDLLARGDKVNVVLHDAEKAERWRARGAEVTVADLRDRATVRDVLARGTSLFLLNPPAPPSSDAEAEERRSAKAILDALEGSWIESVVAASTYGAAPGEGRFDLGVLGDMEEALARIPVASTIVRGAFYMTNWDLALGAAAKEGKLETFYPRDLVMPMVDPTDLGALDAKLLAEVAAASVERRSITGGTKKPAPRGAIVHAEGPARYSANDVAAAFARALRRTVEAIDIPRDRWMETLRGRGYSERSAASFCGMIESSVDADPPSEGVVRGRTTLEEHIEALVRTSRN